MFILLINSSKKYITLIPIITPINEKNTFEILNASGNISKQTIPVIIPAVICCKILIYFLLFKSNKELIIPPIPLLIAPKIETTKVIFIISTVYIVIFFVLYYNVYCN